MSDFKRAFQWLTSEIENRNRAKIPFRRSLSKRKVFERRAPRPCFDPKTGENVSQNSFFIPISQKAIIQVSFER